MKHIVVIGNSAAAIGAVEVVREKDKASRITLISEESFAAYERPRILEILDNKLKERQVVWRGLDFYKNNNIDLLLEAKVTAVSTHRKRVHLKDKDPLEYDELVIACGRKEILPTLKGIQKEGVVGLNNLTDVKFIQENLPLSHTVLVIGQGPVAEAMAKIIAAKKIEVKFFGSLTEPAEGIEVIVDNPVTEILGEADVRAVRLASQKVLGATLIIFSGKPGPCVDFLDGTDVICDNGILVDETLHTNVAGIWAAGDAARVKSLEKVYGWQAAYAEGRLLGQYLGGV